MTKTEKKPGFNAGFFPGRPPLSSGDLPDCHWTFIGMISGVADMCSPFM